MKCEKCNINQATARIVYNINGKVTELNLCSSCAAENGYKSLLSSFDLSSFFGGIFSANALTSPLGPNKKEQSCPKCGATFSSISQHGKMGCAECYNTFYDALLPSLRRLHGTVEYKGGLPESAGSEIKRKRKLSELKDELGKAVVLQEYEKAAELRDRIKELEGGEQIDEKNKS